MLVPQAQALQTPIPGGPVTLDVTVSVDRMSWALLQGQQGKLAPLGFWSPLWKGAESQYSPIDHKV